MSEDARAAYALFLDFDGTLVEIAGRPDAVVVSPDLPALLDDLRASLGGALAVVTGRALADIDGFLPGLALDGCGLHGIERRIGGRSFSPDLPAIPAAIADLQRRFADRPGVIVEDKRVGVGLHWRLAPDEEADAKAAIIALARDLGSGYRVQDGKAVSEVVPIEAGKGAGIRAMMTHPPYADRCPIFAGDDRTDEDGFAAVLSLGGSAIKIGPGPTGADLHSASVETFRSWLERCRRAGIDLSTLSPGRDNESSKHP